MAVLDGLAVREYRETIDFGLLIDVVAFDWNSPQLIEPRFIFVEIEAATAPPWRCIIELGATVAKG